MNKFKNSVKLIGIFLLLILGVNGVFVLASSFINNDDVIYNETKAEVEVLPYFSNSKEDVVYLSDIEYLTGRNQSFAGWDQIRYNETNVGKITLKIENGAFTFDKGIWAHATSQITYDISEYNYKYFTSYLGINTTSGAGNGVIFKIYTSTDGKNWGDAYQYTKLPGQEATFIKIDIEGAKYLRLVADSNGSNASDHSVYAEAKLTNSELQYSSSFKTPEEYDEIIKGLYNNQADLTGELEFNILKRQLISNVGQFTINSFYNASDDNKAVLDWLMSNQKALRYYILGGKPNGSYYNSLTELARLYRNYKEDFENKEVTQYGNVLGDLYLRMATSLSLTHSGLVGLWMSASTPENKSDSVRRYAIMKFMHKNNLFTGEGGTNYNSWFEDYTVEEMRYVMMNNIDDESILWFNAYTQELIDKEGGARLWPHRYISYVWPNYANPVYYAEENMEYFNELFSVKKTALNSGKEILDENGNPTGRIGMWDVSYTIPGGKDVPEYTFKITRGTESAKVYKVWMNLRNKFGTGAVCGGISKTGSNIRGVHGLPDAVVGQPGHAAHINYFQNSKGEGFWGIDNDVSGWAYTGPGGRSLLGWGNASFASGNSGTYIPLAQEVVNHNDTYEQSQKFVYLANSYSDLAKKEEMYRKALEIQPLHLEAWYGLINVYNQSSNKTEDDYYELAKEIAESLKYYPLPMYQMTNHVKPKLTSIGASYKFTLLQTRILKEASAIPNTSTEVLQPGITKLMGNFLLGQMDTSIATFSFDGEDAGKIVLSSRFDGNGVRWDYAIRGKGENGIWDVKDFKEVSFSAEEEHKLQLTPEEIASITAENDIYIHIVGVNYSEENIYKIDISESAGLPATLFASDLENKLLGAVDSLQWKYKETDPWKYYGNTQPELTGDKTIIVRMGATGTYLASKTSTTFTFTEDSTDKTRKYIPVSHLSLHAVSTEATSNQGSATFALDANYNTRWHSAWNGSDTQRFITVKLDQPYNISAVEFVPAGGGNGKIYDGTVFGSMDGENWIVLSQKKNITYTNQANTVQQAIDNIKSFDVEAPQKVQYVKIVADRTNGNWITARAFNFYEDTTIKNVASFSFDGVNPGTIELYDEFKGTKWKYSIDNGKTWITVKEDSHKLSQDEIEKIDEESMIKIKLDNDNTEYKIKIKKGITPTKGYLNDLENRPIAQPEKEELEWKISGSSNWTSYSDEEPNVKGTKTLYVRRKATGLTTASDSIEYEFTDDNQPNNRKYVSINHLTISAYNSQSKDASRPYYAPNAIDGNINTMWHSDFAEHLKNAGKKAYLVIKLDEVKNISAMEFIQKKYRTLDPCLIKTGIAYVSMDGENWTEAGRIENMSQEENVWRTINFAESKKAQYVKLEMETYDMFASILMINLFEDVSKREAPTAEIEYDIKNNTNQQVTAKLVNPSTKIRVTNNSGRDTHVFTENGSFTFEFVDEYGNKGTATAKVDWIIKTLPTATITYNTTKPTNQNVTAEISFDRDKTRIVDENGNTIKTLSLGEKYVVTFTNNGTKEVKFVGPYGNAGSKKLKVNWIDKTVPIATIEYSTTKPTNKDVVATIKFNENNVTVTSEGGNTHTFTENGEFTFEFTDKAGNKGTAKAKVDYIDRKLAMPTITYNKTSPTNKDVVATVTFDKENVEITNNDGKNTYTFTENGTFEFKFIGPAGNEGVATAKVNWIDKKVPEATISYNPTNITNKDVVATISFDEENVTITNNGGKDTYTFAENGSFKFEFKDKAGNKGTITAYVNTIDKILPTAKIKFNITSPTNKDVIATLYDESEEITILSKGGKTHTFTENGEFTFEFADRAGNKVSKLVNVDWIDKDAPIGTISYSKTTPTKDGVIATISFNEENVIINNNSGKNTYVFKENGEFTFEFTDKVGNKGTAKAKVDWINKDAPIGTVSYSINELTNKNVIATLNVKDGIKVTNNSGSKTYTFTKNGTFKFEFVDELGNKGAAIASVDWIDKDAPVAEVSFNKSTITNKDVIATISFKEENVAIINNNHKNTYTFTKNGEFTFEFEDSLGNRGTKKIIVNWIDKEAPVGTITYNKTNPTNTDVIATIKFNEENVTITNNDYRNTHTFTKNGEFKFEFVDKAGNKGTATAKVDWIDKEAPVGKITYSINELTNKDVVATISFEEDVIITNKTHTFTKNGEYTFEFTDKVGNKGTAVAKVDWIDKEAPVGKITYSINELTNKDVVATINFEEEDVIITDKTHTFTKNGEYTFEFTDKVGNKGTAVAKVDWIDKEAPVGTFTYSVTDITNKDVVATIKFNEENVTITNNDGKNTYTFTENGEYTFEFTDKVGNKGTATAKVDWINKNAPIGTITYGPKELTNKDVIATLNVKDGVKVTNNNGSKTHTFTENGVFTFEFVDESGNKGTATAKVDWIDKKAPVGEVTYNINSLTNKDVVATIKFDEENVTINNNSGKKTYVFKENGEFTFEFTDMAGNKGTKVVKVDWIDKKVAKATIKYNITELTNKDVVATVTFDKKDVTIKNNNSSNSYTFTKNGEFVFEYVDKAGNEGTVKAVVNWISKVVPECSVEYNINKLTNQDVIATIKFKNNDITITNNNGKNTYTFKENGEFTFEFVDKAGNKGDYTVKVDWIDKVVATAKIIYSTTTETANDVIATITSDEEIFVINNNGMKSYTFKENGEFEFAYEDSLGNKGHLLAKVNWIKKNNNSNNNPNNNVPSTKPVDRPISSNNASADNNSYGTGNTSSDTSKDNTIVDVADPKDSDDEKDNLKDEEESKLELRNYLDQDDKTNMGVFKIILFILIAVFISLSFIYGLILKRNNSK